MANGTPDPKGLRGWLDSFPTHAATVASALLLILAMGTVVLVRLARGLPFPDGYDVWIGALLGMIGVTSAAGIGRRMTDYDAMKIKAGAVPSPVAAGAGSTVNVAPEAPSIP